MDRRQENPAKTYLRRYRALVAQQESLQRSIDAAFERATSCTAKIKPVNVQSSGSQDRMGEDIARAIDETVSLREAKSRVDAACAEVLTAIQAVPDEMQRTVLMLRYVEGLDWISISERIGYEISNTYILHGRALWSVRKWMEGKHESNRDNL